MHIGLHIPDSERRAIAELANNNIIWFNSLFCTARVWPYIDFLGDGKWIDVSYCPANIPSLAGIGSIIGTCHIKHFIFDMEA
jgi:hypothetical protein